MVEKRKIQDERATDEGAEATQGLYVDPTIYDILYTPGTAAEVDALERIERALSVPDLGGPRLREKRLWFEPACGTGRCLRVAAGRGRRVAGFDREPAVLEYARRRLPGAVAASARLFQADLDDFNAAAGRAGLKPGSVDFAFITVNSLRHLGSDRAMLAHFAQMAGLLRPGALYVVGLSLTDYQWAWPEEDLWTATRGRCKVSQLINYLPPEPGAPRGRVERAISHLTVERPGSTDHFDDAYDLRCYDHRQWRALLRKTPLEHAGSFNALGRELPPGIWPYQLEALRRPWTGPANPKK